IKENPEPQDIKGRPNPKLVTRYSLLLLKLSVSATLFYLLISRIGGKTILNNIRLLNPASFAAAVGLYIFAAYLSTLRWKLLIPQHIETRRLFSMYMIGSFFNTYMPGSIGGDAVKVYYMSRELKSGIDMQSHADSPILSEGIVAIASVFMDRYIGFSALICISLIAFPFGMNYLKGASLKWPVIWIVPSIAAIFLFLSIVIFKFRLGERLKFLLKAYHYFQIYLSKKDVLIRAFLYSLIIQVLGVTSVYVLSKALSLNISFLSLLIFLPIIILVSMLPLSISGIGLREGAFVFLLGTTGVPPEMAMTLSIVWFLSVFVAGIWGLFEYLRFKAMFGREEKQKPFQIP
ncbi:MAG: flippase-like domain-containing protein, partial [Nitrospirae bacterium]|nr:flippase-like domain-containing protein [Nitrospirota bacterium]